MSLVCAVLIWGYAIGVGIYSLRKPEAAFERTMLFVSIDLYRKKTKEMREKLEDQDAFHDATDECYPDEVAFGTNQKKFISYLSIYLYYFQRPFEFAIEQFYKTVRLDRLYNKELSGVFSKKLQRLHAGHRPFEVFEPINIYVSSTHLIETKNRESLQIRLGDVIRRKNQRSNKIEIVISRSSERNGTVDGLEHR